jgi:flagellar biosynthesis/type III secretory pathway protein FliH
MKYISSIELIAMQEGREEGMEKGKILGQIELLKRIKTMKMLAKDQYSEMMQSLKSQLNALSQANPNFQPSLA